MPRRRPVLSLPPASELDTSGQHPPLPSRASGPAPLDALRSLSTRVTAEQDELRVSIFLGEHSNALFLLGGICGHYRARRALWEGCDTVVLPACKSGLRATPPRKYYRVARHEGFRIVWRGEDLGRVSLGTRRRTVPTCVLPFLHPRGCHCQTYRRRTEREPLAVSLRAVISSSTSSSVTPVRTRVPGHRPPPRAPPSLWYRGDAT